MRFLLLQRHLQYHWHQLGKTGRLGLALVFLAAVAWFILLQQGQHELETTQKRTQSVVQQIAAKSALPVDSTLNKEEQLRVFYQNFGSVNQVPDMLDHIYGAAAKQNLELETGEYSQSLASGERLARYRVMLPVKGSFKQVLGFMDAVLRDKSTVALENASFKREKVDDAAVEAKIVFTVFVDSQQ